MYLYFLFYTTMSECMIFYGPTVPEINYSSSSSNREQYRHNELEKYRSDMKNIGTLFLVR